MVAPEAGELKPGASWRPRGLGIGTSRIEAGGLRDVGAYKGAPPTDGLPMSKDHIPGGRGWEPPKSKPPNPQTLGIEGVGAPKTDEL